MMARRVTINAGDGNLEEWLSKNKPSESRRTEGVAWIQVNRPRSYKRNRDPSIVDIMREWQELQRSGKPVTKQAIIDLASKHHFTTGKWLFYVNTGVAVDNIWRKVAKAVYKGTIPSVSAKVSPVTPGKPTHLICVYNDDFTDREEVMACEKALRGLDLQCVMHYKPDIYTDLNIYILLKSLGSQTNFVYKYV